jgi:serine/threonine protein kinase
MEYVGGGSLYGYLKSKPTRRLEEWDAKRIFKKIVQGINYCH